jgi:hypothetical protein
LAGTSALYRQENYCCDRAKIGQRGITAEFCDGITEEYRLKVKRGKRVVSKANYLALPAKEVLPASQPKKTISKNTKRKK